MYRLKQSITKEIAVLLRDKVGLLLMFAMPILLVFVITTLQDGAFKVVNDHQIRLVIFNDDNGPVSNELKSALQEVGMFQVLEETGDFNQEQRSTRMEELDALVGMYLHPNFSKNLTQNADEITSKTLSNLGLPSDSSNTSVVDLLPLEIYYSPVLQESYRHGVQGALQSSVQLIQSRKMLNNIYFAINEESMPEEVEKELIGNSIPLIAQTVTGDGTGKIPNATQHNVPAWTIFAMFFMVVSLGSNLIKEKRNGSFIRLKTMPGAFLYNIVSKQIVYVFASLVQVALIFSIGVLVFPHLGLPALDLPNSLVALFVVALACGFCAVSYALCIGVYANTEEQGNGFGAVSIVIFAALGGIFVPTFAMPDAFKIITAISPLYWCLEGFYELFLNNGTFGEVIKQIIPIFAFIAVLQIVAFTGLKRKNLV